MKIATAAEMRAIDAGCGIPSRTLMENAAHAAVRAAMRLAEAGEVTQDAVVIAGRGNNGGDGYAVARMLLEAGWSVAVVAVCAPEALTGDAAEQCRLAKNVGVSIAGIESLQPRLAAASLVIDALFGTGFDIKRMSPDTAAVIEAINSRRAASNEARVLALDIPSGLCADTGLAAPDPASGRSIAVQADVTVTFGVPKRGLTLNDGISHCGEIVSDDIGIPSSCFDSLRCEIFRSCDAAGLLPRRSPLAHKGSARVAILGGSAGMTGAVSLAALAALRANAGHVFTVTPSGATPATPVEAVHRILPSREDGVFSEEAAAPVEEMARSMHAVVLGGGMGRSEAARRLAMRWTSSLPVPTVVDADALMLTSLAHYAKMVVPRVLTPHPGEFAHLFGGTIRENERRRIEATAEAAKRCGHVVVMKGRPTVTASPDGRIRVNASGDERLATCGSGDVLAGVIGALLAQGLAPFDAAACGALLHGETTKSWPHPVGLTAGDVANLLPEAWALILNGAPVVRLRSHTVR